MKKLFFSSIIILSALTMSSCKPPDCNCDTTQKPVIFNFKQNPVLPTDEDVVVIYAQVTAGEGKLTAVNLIWKIDGVQQPSIEMETMSSFSVTIPVQSVGTVVEYKIVAENSTGGKAELSGSYTVRSTAYAVLRINEVNGVAKWFEIYNMGTFDVNLAGVQAYYNNTAIESYTFTWIGKKTHIIPAGGYLVVIGRGNDGEEMETGLSANNGYVKLQLRTPNGDVIDTYEKNLDINTGYSAIKNKSHARIPDGTGDWYYTIDGVGTKGATNGTSTAGCVKFGDETDWMD